MIKKIYFLVFSEPYWLWEIRWSNLIHQLCKIHYKNGLSLLIALHFICAWSESHWRRPIRLHWFLRPFYVRRRLGSASGLRYSAAHVLEVRSYRSTEDGGANARRAGGRPDGDWRIRVSFVFGNFRMKFVLNLPIIVIIVHQKYFLQKYVKIG